MKSSETKKLVSLIKISVYPEQVFGTLDKESLKDKFRVMARLLHPDTLDAASGVTSTEAAEAFSKLNTFNENAEKRITAGIYGNILALLKPIIVTTKKEVYTLTDKKPPTDIANVYKGTNKAGDLILLKVAKSGNDNDLIQNEVTILKKLRTDEETKDLGTLQHCPKVVDSFINVSGKLKQAVAVFEYGETENWSLHEVYKRFPDGVPLEHLAWMFNRLLGSLEASHMLNIAHGGIVPSSFVIHPKTHNGILTNWDFAVPVGEKLKGLMGGSVYRSFYPPEVFKKEPIDLGLDLFMLAKLFIFMSGGSVNSNTFPENWEKIQTPTAKEGYRKIKGLMASCLLVKGRRTTNVAALYTDFRAALELIFGPPTWREFTMP